MITVLYIVGAGNSGSTMLSMALGAHSQMVSVGELSQLDRYRSLDLPCSCSERVSSCPLWGNIDDYLGPNNYSAPVKPMNSLFNLFVYRSSCLHRDAHCFQVITRNLELYRQISAITGKTIIVDASKDLMRLYYLFRSGRIRIMPLYLSRDGRAYIDSMARRRNWSSARSVIRWARMNLATEFVLRRMRVKDQSIKLTYERFTKEPVKCIREICNRLGIGYEPEMSRLYTQSTHNIAGSFAHFSSDSITPHEAWRERLTKSSRLIFALLGGHYLNRRFGINSD